MTQFDWKGLGDKCSECHKDIHRGQFSREEPVKECEACHVQSSFYVLSFDHDTDSRFPLTGSHEKVACDACHFSESPQAPVQYRPLDMSCASCHYDIHLGQFAEASEGPRMSLGETRCESCHDTASFAQNRFDHNDPAYSDYPLEGRHIDVPCRDCHGTVNVTTELGALEVVRYRPVPKTCIGCHDDYHNGTLAGVE